MENQNPTTVNRIKFESIDENTSIIKVIGVGGGGSNAVNYMYNQGIEGVDFIICNTDRQALNTSSVPVKIQLGKEITLGLGAGAKPEVGRNAALESTEELKTLLAGSTKMLFITAGMGGGTGTGAAPVIANISKELGILTVAIVTMPFSWEGKKKSEQALEGINELKKNVDSLLLISNDKLREFFGNLTMSNAFSKADDVLKVAAKGISDIVNKIGKVNVDFEDVNTVIRNSGVAIMGSGESEGENRAVEAIEKALSSPLLNDNNINGASNILLYITSGTDEITMDEFEAITQHIQKEAGLTAEIIWGICQDESLGNKIAITIVATGFDYNELANSFDIKHTTKKKVINLEDEKHTEVKEKEKVRAIDNPLMDENSDEVRVLRNKYQKKENEVKIDIPENNEELIKDALDFEVLKKQINEVPTEITNQSVEDVETNFTTDEVEEFNIPESLSFREEQTENIESLSEKNEDNIIINEIPNIPLNGIPIDEHSTLENEIVVKANTERNRRLKEMSERIGSNRLSDIEKIEREPAYLRKNVVLSSVLPANESRVSKYTLGEDEDKNLRLKENNSFLHNNPD